MDGQNLSVSTAISAAQQGQPINTFQRLFLWLKSILIPHADAHEEAAEVQLNKITFSRMDDPFKFRDKVTRLLGIAGYHQDQKAARKVIRMLPDLVKIEVRAQNPMTPNDVFTITEDIHSYTYLMKLDLKKDLFRKNHIWKH